jgi:hypothetical protein
MSISIVNNTNGLTISNPTQTGYNISNIQEYTSSGTCLPSLVYDINSGAVQYTTNQSAKSFVIDHPNESNKFLVHACLEGPEAGVYYRGKAAIQNGEYVVIQLPNYVENLAKNFTVHITEIYDEATKGLVNPLKTTEVVNNQFKVYGNNGSFFWIVYGERLSIDVEPSKSTPVYGSGPYKWI